MSKKKKTSSISPATNVKSAASKSATTLVSEPRKEKIQGSRSQTSENLAVTRLCKKISYNFSDASLLIEAITHRSKHSLNNERLEFLGDSVLGYVISSELFQRFPEAREGQLTRGRAALVKGETLAELALEMELGDHLLLGPGELKSGGHRRKSILADAMEAIIGAIYLDGGLEAAKQHIIRVYSTKLENLSLDDVGKDPKTQLQEYLQARKHPLPDYEVIATSGSDHDQIFKVSCNISVIPESITGTGRSRRKAEQDAAARVLKLLQDLKLPGKS